LLEDTLNQRYRYPDAAYNTVHLPKSIKLVPDLPSGAVTANAIGIEMPGIILPHRKIDIAPANDWETILERDNLSFVTVIERHGKSDGGIAYGLLHDFGIKNGAVGSSVGHDSHNIILAGTNEADMQLALKTIETANGGIAVVENGKVLAFVALPVAGLMSDKRVHEVATENQALKKAWQQVGCTIPYMGFNLIPLSVIPEIRITDKGLVKVPEMILAQLFD
jgi:adenine deaminase